MHSKSKTFIWVSAIITISAGCRKDSLPVLPEPVTKNDMLTYSYWRIAAQGFDTTNDGSIDIDETPTLPCMLDNRTYFFADGYGSFDQGEIKCDPNHNQSRQFEWVFTANETMIIVDGQQYKILALSKNDFIISYNDTFTAAPNTYIMKFIH